MNAVNSDQTAGIAVVVSPAGVSKIPATGPAAAALRARNAAELNGQLFVLMDNAGHNPRSIDKLANKRNMTGLSKSTVQRYLSGPKRGTLFPNQAMLVNFVTLCGAQHTEIMCFVEAWKNLRDGRLPELPAQQCTESTVEPPHPVVDLFGTPPPGDRVVKEYRLQVTDGRMMKLFTHLLTVRSVLGVLGAGVLWGGVFMAKRPMTTHLTAVAAGLLIGPLVIDAAVGRVPVHKDAEPEPEDLAPRRGRSSETVAAQILPSDGKTVEPVTAPTS